MRRVRGGKLGTSMTGSAAALRKGGKRARWILVPLCLAVLALSGCMTAKYKEGVAVDMTVREDKVAEIARHSTDIHEFVSKVYDVDPATIRTPYFKVYSVYYDQPEDKTRDVTIFTAYAEARGGKIYQYRPFLNYGPKFYVNEMAGRIDSVLAYFPGGEIAYNGVVPCEYSIGYMTEQGFNQYVKQQGLTRVYTSEDNSFWLKQLTYATNHFIMKIHYSNREKETREMDFSLAKIRYKGLDYKINFIAEAADEDFFYRMHSTSNVKQATPGKFHLAPGETFDGSIELTVQGLTARDINGAVLTLGQLNGGKLTRTQEETTQFVMK